VKGSITAQINAVIQAPCFTSNGCCLLSPDNQSPPCFTSDFTPLYRSNISLSCNQNMSSKLDKMLLPYLVTTLSSYSLIFIASKKKKSTLKHFNFFHFLYHINNFFLPFKLKKLTTIQLFFILFFTQILSTLYHINHFLVLPKKKKKKITRTIFTYSFTCVHFLLPLQTSSSFSLFYNLGLVDSRLFLLWSCIGVYVELPRLNTLFLFWCVPLLVF
jgi:hypothetical protein